MKTKRDYQLEQLLKGLEVVLQQVDQRKWSPDNKHGSMDNKFISSLLTPHVEWLREIVNKSVSSDVNIHSCILVPDFNKGTGKILRNRVKQFG